LRIYLLGRFEVIRDGMPLSGGGWRSRQNRTILKLLVARQGEMATIDQIIELLWPQENPEAARRYLHVRLSQLRRTLDPHETEAYISTVEEGYVFNPRADCWVDSWEFEARAEAGRHLQESGNLLVGQLACRMPFLNQVLFSSDWVMSVGPRATQSMLPVSTAFTAGSSCASPLKWRGTLIPPKSNPI